MTAYRVIGVDRIFLPDAPASSASNGLWYGLVPQADDPVPAGFTSYAWLKDDGTLHLVVEGQDQVVAVISSNGFLMAALQLTGTVYNTVLNPKPAASGLRAGQLVRETVGAESPLGPEHLYICVTTEGGAYVWKEITLT